MGEGARIGFPVLAVKFIDSHIEIHPIIQAPPGHGEAVLVGPRHIEALYPAGLTKAVFRAARIERIFRQIVRAFYEPEARRWHDDVNIAAHRADRTIAVFHFERLWKLHLKTNRAAMTASEMCFQLTHVYPYPTQTGGRRSAHGAVRSNCPAS